MGNDPENPRVLPHVGRGDLCLGSVLTMTRPCLVYVQGTRGPMPQIWREPLVTEAGALAVRPEGLQIVAGPFQLVAPFDGSVEGAVKAVAHGR